MVGGCEILAYFGLPDFSVLPEIGKRGPVWDVWCDCGYEATTAYPAPKEWHDWLDAHGGFFGDVPQKAWDSRKAPRLRPDVDVSAIKPTAHIGSFCPVCGERLAYGDAHLVHIYEMLMTREVEIKTSGFVIIDGREPELHELGVAWDVTCTCGYKAFCAYYPTDDWFKQHKDDRPIQFSDATKRAFAAAVRSLPYEWMPSAVVLARIRVHVDIPDDLARSLFMMAVVMGYLEEQEQPDGKTCYRKVGGAAGA